jgi:hypothetical protein
LRYKLRMMGIPVEDAAYIFGDNQSVLVNTDLGKNKLVNNNCNIIAPIIYCYLLQIIDKYWSDLEVLQ